MKLLGILWRKLFKPKKVYCGACGYYRHWSQGNPECHARAVPIYKDTPIRQDFISYENIEDPLVKNANNDCVDYSCR